MKYEYENLEDFLFKVKQAGVAELAIRTMTKLEDAGPVIRANQALPAKRVSAVLIMSTGAYEKVGEEIKEHLYIYQEAVNLPNPIIVSQEEANAQDEAIKARTNELMAKIKEASNKIRIMEGAIML